MFIGLYGRGVIISLHFFHRKFPNSRIPSNVGLIYCIVFLLNSHEQFSSTELEILPYFNHIVNFPFFALYSAVLKNIVKPS